MGAQNFKKTEYEFYKLKTEKNDKSKLAFYKQEKVNDSWAETDTFACMSGYLKDIKVTSFEYDGKPKETVEIHLKDNESDKTLVIKSGFSNILRGLFNSLAGAEEFGLIEMQCGLSRDKKHAALYVKNNGEKCNWKYDWSQVPKVEEIQNKKGEVIAWDSEETDNFFKEVIKNEILSKIKGLPIEAQIPNVKIDPAIESTPVDDLPF